LLRFFAACRTEGLGAAVAALPIMSALLFDRSSLLRFLISDKDTDTDRRSSRSQAFGLIRETLDISGDCVAAGGGGCTSRLPVKDRGPSLPTRDSLRLSDGSDVTSYGRYTGSDR
jgi:hypothetical protein